MELLSVHVQKEHVLKKVICVMLRYLMLKQKIFALLNVKQVMK